jgi:hypothetical protein
MRQLLYAGLAMSTVVLTWRQHVAAFGAAIAIDVAVAIVRWTLDATVSGGHAFGIGALWVVLGCGVVALTRRSVQERSLRLKGVGLGLLLVAGHKTVDTWLLITAKTHPPVLDPYVAVADHALGNPPG